jgi:hypothetical protein
VKEFPENFSQIIAESRNDKRFDQKLWDLSLKFLEGRQWLSFDKNLQKYVSSAARSTDNVTINMLLNVYRNIAARLAVSYPSVVVVPANPSYDDIVKAKTSEMVLQYYWSADNIKAKLTKSIDWLLTTGTVALHTYYDPGDKKVHTDVHGAYDVFFEAGVEEVEDSQWIAIRTFHTKEDLIDAYPNKREEIEGAPTSDYQDDSREGQTTQPSNRVEVYEFYWKDGRHCITVHGIILYKEELDHPKIPVSIIRYTEIPRRIWGLSLLAPLLDLQMLYNRSRTLVLRNVALMSSPKWLVPKTAGVPTSAITDTPGEKIYYNPAGGQPTQVTPAAMPAYVFDNIVRLQSEIGDVAGVHSVTLGKRAVGVTSGKAMQVLSSNDTSQLQGTQDNIERGVKHMAECVLYLMREHYTEERMVRMLDNSGRVAFESIQSTDLVDMPEIFMEAGSLFRNEAQDRDAKVMELLQLGLIDPQTALQELSFRTGHAFATDKTRALAHARDMLEAMSSGAEIEIFMNDDLDAFKRVLTDFMQSTDYYRLSDERQNYIRDVLVSLAAAGQPDEAYQEMLMRQRVWPRPQTDPQIGNVLALTSPAGQGQAIEEMAAGEQRRGTIAAAERDMTKGAEALVTPAQRMAAPG